MKNFLYCFTLIAGFAILGFTGCGGGGGENEVIAVDPAAGGLGNDQASYEEAMKNRTERSGPGN